MKVQLMIGAMALVGLGAVAAACGSSVGSGFEDGAKDSGVELDGSTGPGSNFNSDGGGPTGPTACKALGCADLGITCGPAGNGCGGIIQCGTCASPQTCGGGGTPSVCGGTAGCVAKNCTDWGYNCGPAGDGCGGTIASCGTCPGAEICGAAGPSKCGGGLLSPDGGALYPDGGLCIPRSSCNPNECGPVADGCGGLLTCPVCPSGSTCGGGGVASMCGAPTCTKTTCALAGANCGYIADGCGGILNCGGTTCATGFCGGGGPNKCGTGVDAGVPCTNFCTSVVTTCGAAPTTIKGTVFAPNGTLPLPGALVYIPNASTTYPFGVSSFTDGVSGGSCDTCGGEASGSPLVSTTSAFDGSFTLTNVPAGISFPVVIQLGRWRKVQMMPAVTKCTTVTETAALTSLPSVQGAVASGTQADNIPLFAISTGSVDALECVFRKLGVKDTQFTNPSGTGRIRFYQDTDVSNPAGAAPGAVINTSTPATSVLYGSSTEIDKYDAVIFACPGGPSEKTPTSLSTVQTYANNGGRVFATHYNYTWLYDNSPWSSTANWIPDPDSLLGTDDTGLVSTTAEGGIFDQWLNATGVKALSGTKPDRVAISAARFDAFQPLATGTTSFLTEYNPGTPVPVFHYSFNTPYAAATQCGRVIFSDFHVSSADDSGDTFPTECTTTFTAQEKILAFMLFDLTSCIPSPPPPTCTKATCASQSIACGPAGDGCGNQIDCGPCPSGEVCEGTPAKCVTPPCTPTVCPAGGSCGTLPNGCGGTLNCGPCPTGLICGGGGPSICGKTTCTATTCTAQGISCGPAADGCGNLLDCGPCPPGETCGGGGVDGVCGKPNCTPRTCAEANANCGPVADGCGGIIQCGDCPSGQTCGGGGTPSQCAGSGPVK